MIQNMRLQQVGQASGNVKLIPQQRIKRLWKARLVKLDNNLSP